MTPHVKFLGATGLLVLLAATSLQAQISVTLQPRMGDPIPGLTPVELVRFQAGLAEFNHNLTIPEGLGPIMNQTSCASCHNQPTAGGAGTITVTRFGVAASGGMPFNPLGNLGGSLLQSQAISMGCEESVPVQANVEINRITNSTFGAGLVEAIPDAAIQALATTPPPGISGQVHLVPALEDPLGSPLRVGRFGWKAQVATVLTFSADASLNELGLTNRFLVAENAPNGNRLLLASCDTVADPEDGPDPMGWHRIDRQTDFQRYLAPPPQTPQGGMSGEAVFTSIGCADCHHPSFTTGPAPEVALAGQTIRPYSDFLLHDMGSLGDGIVQGAATENEMRTPSLWGLRARAALLHDGRATGGTFAQNIDAAIQFHDGEAAASRTAYNNLPPASKDQLVAFLNSLGRAEFDWDGDNDIDFIDWFFLRPLLSGPASAVYNPDSPAAVADIEGDGDFDLVDFGLMQRAFTGQ